MVGFYDIYIISGVSHNFIINGMVKKKNVVQNRNARVTICSVIQTSCIYKVYHEYIRNDMIDFPPQSIELIIVSTRTYSMLLIIFMYA